MVEMKPSNMPVKIRGRVIGNSKFLVVQAIDEGLEHCHGCVRAIQIIAGAAHVRPVSCLRIFNDIDAPILEMWKQHPERSPYMFVHVAAIVDNDVELTGP